VIDPDSLDIYAYYGFFSQWSWVRQVVMRFYQKPIIFEFVHTGTGAIDTGIEYFEMPGGQRYAAYNQGDSWPNWVLYCGESGPHTPFIWPNGKPNPPYKNTAAWTLLNNPHPGNDRYKIDTVWVRKLVIPKGTPQYDSWNYVHPDTGPRLDTLEEGQWVESSYVWTDFYDGADSTAAHSFARVAPRRVNPDRWFHAACYVWRQGGTTSPWGLGAAMGRTLFPRGGVAAQSPMIAVARSVPYMAKDNPTDYDFYFTPAWDARLTPFDSLGVVEIAGDTVAGGFAVHTRGAFDHLEELRKYVLLP
jgi:hypothetical protein